MKAPIRIWHICISGFLENPGQGNGICAIWRKLKSLHFGPDVEVCQCSWNDNMAHLAERINRFRTESHSDPLVKVYAYSWGGASAMLLAREMKARGLSIQHMVLADAVYRHRYWVGNWRAFWPFSKLRVPDNVRHVTWLAQRENWPRGHKVVADNPAKTTLDGPWMLDRRHSYVDESTRFKSACERAAKLQGAPPDPTRRAAA